MVSRSSLEGIEVAFDVLEVPEAASDGVLENVVGFSAPKPILSSSLDCSNAGIDGFRKSPFIDARGLSDFTDSVLLPDLITGRLGFVFVGLGDRCRLGPGDGSFDEVASLGRILVRLGTGVFKDFAVLGRFIGV